MVRTRGAFATVVVLAATLVSCSDDDPEPKIGDPTPSAPSTSATVPETVSGSPSVTPGVGPEETVRAWVDARNVALQDGDTSVVSALGATSCGTCEDSLQPIREVYANGGHFETTGWKVLAAKVDEQTETKAKVSAGVEYAAGRTFPNADADPVSYDSEKHVLVFRLELDEGTWRVSFIGYLS